MQLRLTVIQSKHYTLHSHICRAKNGCTIADFLPFT